MEARARIWQQFESGALDADVATAELLALDLHAHESEGQDDDCREPEAPE